MQQGIYEDIYREELTHWWFRARRTIVATMLWQFASQQRPLLIADIGCGMGASFNMLAEFGWVVGVDYSATALTFSRQRGHPRLVAAGLPNLPFCDDRFDVVCALDVIEHIDDDQAAVRELWRICKPGGLLTVTVPAFQWLWSEHDEVNEHKRRYSRQQLRACIAQSNSEWLKLSYMNTVLAPPFILFRLTRNLLGKAKRRTAPPKSDVFEIPPLLNRLCEKCFSAEVTWLRHGSLPFGTSLICVVRKRVPVDAN